MTEYINIAQDVWLLCILRKIDICDIIRLQWEGGALKRRAPGNNRRYNMAGNNEYKNKWISEKLDRINLTMPKGKKDIIKAHAESKGESVNSFINRAVDETIKRDGEDK